MDPVTQCICDEICAEHAPKHKMLATAVGGPFMDTLQKIVKWLRDHGITIFTILKWGGEIFALIKSGASFQDIIAWLAKLLWPTNPPALPV